MVKSEIEKKEDINAMMDVACYQVEATVEVT
jgi:hypothetical protein